MDNKNLYKSSESTKEPSGMKLFWQNLSQKQKIGFVIGGVIIVILLVIGFVASMNAMQDQSGSENNETVNSGEESSEGGNTENGGDDGYIDPIKTPIEGGDVNNIDTYLPHEATIEISPELSEDDIFDIEYSIDVDKNNKIITIYLFDEDDAEVRARAEAYLATIPAEVLEGYKIETTVFYDEENSYSED
ncbi:hypothetical protein IKF33_02690 [Candidatus Saccharibacteria bacterium]|nr:hypothetical protein [Candidatus Saccharibacteria bacterium]